MIQIYFPLFISLFLFLIEFSMSGVHSQTHHSSFVHVLEINAGTKQTGFSPASHRVPMFRESSKWINSTSSSSLICDNFHWSRLSSGSRLPISLPFNKFTSCHIEDSPNFLCFRFIDLYLHYGYIFFHLFSILWIIIVWTCKLQCK